jgi:hypothetical protein
MMEETDISLGMVSMDSKIDTDGAGKIKKLGFCEEAPRAD